jgi:hypothetical protein
MVTAAQMRKLALSLPETEERSHFEQPDFRVRNKIFAGLSQDETLGTLKLPPELQAALIEAHPDVFFPAAGAWGRSGWTRVTLSNAKLDLLRPLVREAWRLIAPKTLLAADSGTQPAPKARKASKRKRSKPGR